VAIWGFFWLVCNFVVFLAPEKRWLFHSGAAVPRIRPFAGVACPGRESAADHEYPDGL